ncbi:transmembrane protein, putative [Medicago truncatula]|uniref:Transmembrane protein, putative n=2 Tax=Medicago truncatula TaxID=3880 RepID=A0A072TZY2_MEDTR|nr:transmembrane protein, putative [Medicago truncatula]
MTQNGFSCVLLITSMQRVKGLKGQQKMVFGKLLERTGRLRLGVAIILLGLRKLLFTIMVVFLVLKAAG